VNDHTAEEAIGGGYDKKRKCLKSPYVERGQEKNGINQIAIFKKGEKFFVAWL